MYGTNEFKKGLKVEIDGEPYVMTDCQFVKPGKGNAFTRTKLKHMVSGAVIDRTYKSGEKLGKANLSEQPMQYMYEQDSEFHFMNMNTYEQVAIGRDRIDDAAKWLHEELEVEVLFHNGAPISIDMPNFVELQVTQCDPGVKGDTKSNATKPATLTTGAVIQVPMFVEPDEWLRIDTRTGDYVERVKK
ncbi:MAG: elongation factor P [bacterium]|nr:elongation factor P [bacterium]